MFYKSVMVKIATFVVMELDELRKKIQFSELGKF